MININLADKIEIIVLMDNYSDVLLTSTEKAQRPPLAHGSKMAGPLICEHGLSLFVEVFKENRSHKIIMDGGWSETGVINNINALDIDISDVEAVVLSHGHMDHFGSFEKMSGMFSGKVPLILHPDALLTTRFLRIPDGREVRFPILNESSLEKAGYVPIKTRFPYLLASSMIATTGEIKRVTDFEKGMPGAFYEKNGEIKVDTIRDDLSLILNLKDKGLVIISGCAHSGIINTVRHIRKITGIDKVYAVIGGFHLSGPAFEPLIGTTVSEMKKINPEIVIPMHCTGFKATQSFAQNMPDQFIPSSVGVKISL